MLNIKVVNIIGIILIFLGLSMIPSSLWSLAESIQYNLSDVEFYDFIGIIKSSIITIIFGLILYLTTIYYISKKILN